MMMTSPELSRCTTVQQSRANAIRRYKCRPPAASVEPLIVVNADNEGWERLELIVNINDRHDLRERALRFINAGGDVTGHGSRQVTTCAELVRLPDGLLILRLIQRRYLGVGLRGVVDMAELSFRIPMVPIKVYCHNHSENRVPGQLPKVESLQPVGDEETTMADPADTLIDAIQLVHECTVYVVGFPIFLTGIHYREEVWRLKPKPAHISPQPIC